MGKKLSLESFIKGMPKAELHLHIEGSLEPELKFEIAKRNNIAMKYKSVGQMKKAYKFNNLQDFLNIYYEGAGVLKNEKDFYDLTWAYLEKAHSQNVLHTEIFFDPQTHTSKGVYFNTVIEGIHGALVDAEEKFGISSKLIMCFLRDLNPESAMKTLEEAMPYKDWIIGVGLDSAEVGNPPSKFREVFDAAYDEGFLTVAHAGEEGPAEYVWEVLKMLRVSRVDHGNRSLEDGRLVDRLVDDGMPLTVCPLSNLKLKVVRNLKEHPLKKMMKKRLMVTVNSDDPAYFGGYVNENYVRISKALDLTKKDVYRLAKNSFKSSFLKEREKSVLIEKLDEYMRENGS